MTQITDLDLIDRMWQHWFNAMWVAEGNDFLDYQGTLREGYQTVELIDAFDKWLTERGMSLQLDRTGYYIVIEKETPATTALLLVV